MPNFLQCVLIHSNALGFGRLLSCTYHRLTWLRMKGKTIITWSSCFRFCYLAFTPSNFRSPNLLNCSGSKEPSYFLKERDYFSKGCTNSSRMEQLVAKEEDCCLAFACSLICKFLIRPTRFLWYLGIFHISKCVSSIQSTFVKKIINIMYE